MRDSLYQENYFYYKARTFPIFYFKMLVTKGILRDLLLLLMSNHFSVFKSFLLTKIREFCWTHFHSLLQSHKFLQLSRPLIRENRKTYILTLRGPILFLGSSIKRIRIYYISLLWTNNSFGFRYPFAKEFRRTGFHTYADRTFQNSHDLCKSTKRGLDT